MDGLLDGCSIQPEVNSCIQWHHITDQCGKAQQSTKLPVHSYVSAKEKHTINIEKVYLCHPSSGIE